jgi:hypothetical protein
MQGETNRFAILLKLSKQTAHLFYPTCIFLGGKIPVMVYYGGRAPVGPWETKFPVGNTSTS